MSDVTSQHDSLKLRREIARHPDDLALRKAWAQGAERLGDHSRARLVREQLARRAKQTAMPEHRAFASAVETELLEAHPEWREELAPLGVARAELSGGFVESIVVDAATLLELAPAILELAPVRRVRLTGDVRLLPRVVAEGVLERVVWLDLTDLRVNAELLASLAGTSGLRALGLAGAGVTDALVETIWASFPRLLVCELDRNPCAELVTQELTWQEMSSYEWFATERARALEEKYGARSWIHPSSWPGGDRVDLEMLLARIARGW